MCLQAASFGVEAEFGEVGLVAGRAYTILPSWITAFYTARGVVDFFSPAWREQQNNAALLFFAAPSGVSSQETFSASLQIPG